MGKGKGAVDHWVAVVRPGKVLFEVANVPKELAQSALRRAAAKLGLKDAFCRTRRTSVRWTYGKSKRI